MAELDVFERDLARAYLRLVEDVPCHVDAAAVARRVAGEHPRGAGRTAGRRLATMPRAAWLLLVVASIVLGLVAAIAVGSLVERRADVQPRPTVAPTAVPSAPSTAPPTPGRSRALTPAEQQGAIAALRRAWQFGDTAGARDVLAADATLTVEWYGPTFFEVAEPRGYTYWESSGETVHAGAYAAEPGVAGVWDPGVDVVATFRFGPDGRITDRWFVVGRYTPTRAHEGRKEQASPVGGALLAWLDACSVPDPSPAGRSGCYADDAELRISAGAARGGWTETYTGRGAVVRWMASPTVFDGGVRTGDAVRLGNLVTRPFVGPAGPCAEGIDILELTPDLSRIARRSTICGPGT